jgi:hypothetical protein
MLYIHEMRGASAHAMQGCLEQFDKTQTMEPHLGVPRGSQRSGFVATYLGLDIDPLD